MPKEIKNIAEGFPVESSNSKFENQTYSELQVDPNAKASIDLINKQISDVQIQISDVQTQNNALKQELETTKSAAELANNAALEAKNNAIEAKVDAVEAKKNAIEAKTEAVEAKKDFLTIFGLFVSFLTFISIEIQILKSAPDIYALFGLSSLMLGGIILFVSMLANVVKKNNEWTLKISPLICCLLFLVAAGSCFFLRFNKAIEPSVRPELETTLSQHGSHQAISMFCGQYASCKPSVTNNNTP